MEEVHDNNSNLSANVKSHASSNLSSNLLKIVRKGDKIYHTIEENVTMVKEVDDETKLSVNSQDAQVDKISSGESLYKSFSFDNVISKEETEKCISFWRSVVEKNLEPVKCSIIESLNNRTQTATNDNIKVKEKNNKKQKKTDKKLQKDTTKHARRSSVWYNILGELQKRRLNQTKLLIEKRCRLCEYMLSDRYETDDIKQQTMDEIIALDDWIPKSTKPKRSSTNSRSAKRVSTSNSEGKTSHKSSLAESRTSTKKSTDSSVAKEVLDQVVEELSIGSETDDHLLERVKEASNKIEFIDAIEKKKREQIYSKWRNNKLEDMCKCLRPECDCNTNPAVVHVLNSNKVQDEKKEKESTEVSLPVSDQPFSNPTTIHQKEDFSLMEAVQNEKKEKELPELPLPVSDQPNLITIHQKEDFSLMDEESRKFAIYSEVTNDSKEDGCEQNIKEIRRTDINFNITDDTKEDDFQPTIKRNHSGSPHDVHTILPRPKKSILIMKDDDKETTKSKTHMGDVKHCLSMILQCNCDNDDCDCGYVVKPIEKPVIKPDDLNIPSPPTSILKSQRLLSRTDSLEVIRRRMSSIRPSRVSQIAPDTKLK